MKEEMEVAELPQEPYFVDFLREAPEPTGEEPEDADLEAPKIYEQVSPSVCPSVSEKPLDELHMQLNP